MAGSVLVVDDDPSLAESLRAVLVSRGVLVDSATDTATATSRLERGSYCGVILDLVLPDGSGFDVLRYMRQNGDQTAVVVVTSNLPSYVQEMLGADQVRLVFPKPVEPRLLAAVVLGLCGIAS